MESQAVAGDVFGPDGVTSGWQVTITYTEAEVVDLLSRYVPESGTSPGVGDARATARAVLNAVLDAVEGSS